MDEGLTLYIVDAIPDRGEASFDRYLVRSSSLESAGKAVESFLPTIDRVEVEEASFQHLHTDLPRDTPILIADGEAEFVSVR